MVVKGAGVVVKGAGVAAKGEEAAAKDEGVVVNDGVGKKGEGLILFSSLPFSAL